MPRDHQMNPMLGLATNEIQRSLNGLGDTPNDFEAAWNLQYTPVREGWYYGQPIQNVTVPVVRPALGGGLGGFADGAPDAATGTSTDKLRTALQVVSTVAITVMAGLAIYRTVRLRKLAPQGFLADGED